MNAIPSYGRIWLTVLGLWCFASVMLIAIPFGMLARGFMLLFMLPARIFRGPR